MRGNEMVCNGNEMRDEVKGRERGKKEGCEKGRLEEREGKKVREGRGKAKGKESAAAAPFIFGAVQ